MENVPIAPATPVPVTPGALALQDEPVLLTPEVVGRLLRISRSLAYKLVRTGELPRIRIGKRWYVPRRALEILLDEAVAKVQKG